MLILDSIISSAINNLSVFSESHNNIQRIRALSFIPLVSSTAHKHSHIHPKKMIVRVLMAKIHGTFCPSAAQFQRKLSFYIPV